MCAAVNFLEEGWHFYAMYTFSVTMQMKEYIKQLAVPMEISIKRLIERLFLRHLNNWMKQTGPVLSVTRHMPFR